MLGLSSELKKTRFYQEVLEEGKQEGKEENKLETIPRLLPLGLTLAQIAQALDLPLEIVQQTAEAIPTKSTSLPESEANPQLTESPPEVVGQTTELQTAKPLSSNEPNVAAFIELLTKQKTIFSSEELAELNQLVASLPDDIEELSNAIASWCQQDQHAQILKALRQVSQPFSSDAEAKTPDTQQL